MEDFKEELETYDRVCKQMFFEQGGGLIIIRGKEHKGVYRTFTEAEKAGEEIWKGEKYQICVI